MKANAYMEYEYNKYITNPKCLNFLSMVYICILFSSAVISTKLILTPIGPISAGSITGPFWFILSDIIAEVYGFRYSRQIFISAMVCELLFILISLHLIHMQSPVSWHGQAAYNYVFGNLLMIYFCQLVAIVIAWDVNIRSLLKWRMLLSGKYFWLRSIGASGMSEIIFSIISVTLNMFARKHQLALNNSDIINLVLGSIVFKIFFSALFAYPAQIIVKILRFVENIKDETTFNIHSVFKTEQ